MNRLVDFLLSETSPHFRAFVIVAAVILFALGMAL